MSGMSRRGTVPPFIVMDVVRAATDREAQGLPVWHMEVGQPSLGVPKGVTESLKGVLDSDALGYTVALGLPELRRRIAAHYQRTQGVEIDPQRVVVTTGSSTGFILAFAACFEVGARVGLAQPGYPAYPSILRSLGIEPVSIPVGPDSRYQPTVEVLERFGQKLDGLIVASPSNPTGTIMAPEELQRLTAYCDANGIRLISDEIYHGIAFGQQAATAARFTDQAVLINSFSKYFCMTGWRLGWLVVPEPMVRGVECLAQNLFISAPALSQHAGIHVFDHIDELEERVAAYGRSRAMLLEELPKAGFSRFAPPDGAFYLYADVADRTNDSLEFCRRMLAETGVAATPGVDFDPLGGSHFVRFSFARDEASLREAVEQLKGWS
ncbi:pyridoxal phosphate-dependent aminotransferase [Novispirillum itersonii]|uniref:aspartate transaminase n=1 Tax=Novispirillum itersonii TaxID=189 RepID=A0A7W9ZFG3_NOVIT|nr:aminotransferase class I/II-fold pyridoxal phosphate-dependent enzyme [Novispirillum itersonii]MBB6209652.1 aspartate/methionine/tyrosine aminotransferase [Novispirillum itersonii]